MSRGKHYFIEQNPTNGKFAVLEANGERTGSYDTQEQAIAVAKRLNPDDHPDVERIRNVATNAGDQWRSAQ